MFEYKLFNQLPAWSQVEVLTKIGAPIAQRQFQDWEITLYTLDNFFVEHWRKNGLEITTSFRKNTAPMLILEPYLDALEIQGFDI